MMLLMCSINTHFYTYLCTERLGLIGGGSDNTPSPRSFCAYETLSFIVGCYESVDDDDDNIYDVTIHRMPVRPVWF